MIDIIHRYYTYFCTKLALWILYSSMLFNNLQKKFPQPPYNCDGLLHFELLENIIYFTFDSIFSVIAHPDIAFFFRFIQSFSFMKNFIQWI
jgi:hypothetical protein